MFERRHVRHRDRDLACLAPRAPSCCTRAGRCWSAEIASLVPAAAGEDEGAGVPVVAVGCELAGVVAPLLGLARPAAPASLLFSGAPEVTTAIATATATSRPLVADHDALLGLIAREVRSAHADRHRDDQRPCDQHPACDVERDFALLGREDRCQLEADVHGREPSRWGYGYAPSRDGRRVANARRRAGGASGLPVGVPLPRSRRPAPGAHRRGRRAAGRLLPRRADVVLPVEEGDAAGAGRGLPLHRAGLRGLRSLRQADGHRLVQLRRPHRARRRADGGARHQRRHGGRARLGRADRPAHRGRAGASASTGS